MNYQYLFFRALLITLSYGERVYTSSLKESYKESKDIVKVFAPNK